MSEKVENNVMKTITGKGTLEIRDARMDERDMVAQLVIAAYQQYDKVMPNGNWQGYKENILDTLSRIKEAQLIVAVVEGHLAGSVTLYMDTMGSPEGWPGDWAGVRLLAVHPDYRGLGIGRALMEECIRRCRENGKKAIGLHTTDMMAVAYGMYERMGFQRIPEYDFVLDNGRVVKAFKLDL